MSRTRGASPDRPHGGGAAAKAGRPARVPAPGSTGEVWRIAYPMVLTSMSLTLANFCDALLLSRYHSSAMAASLSGGVAAFTLIAFFLGLLGYVSPLTAQYLGAGRKRDCGRALWQGLLVLPAAWLALLALIPALGHVFTWFGSEPALAAYQREYAAWCLVGSGPLLIVTTAGAFFSGIGATRIVMVANLLSLAIKAPISYVLIFGAPALSLPSLGVAGAVIGTMVGNALAAALLLAVIFGRQHAAEYGTRRAGYWAAAMRPLLRYGLPTAVESLSAPLAVALFIQLLHGLGEPQAAAATIALRYDLLAYVPMMGFGIGAAACVGKYCGAGDMILARRAGWSACRLTLGYAAAMATLYLVAAPVFVELFRGHGGAGGVLFDDYAPLAQTMVRLAAVYTICDGLGLVCAQALRAAGDTRFCMVVSLVAHWLVMVAPVYVLIRVWGAPRPDGSSALDALPHRGAILVWGFLIAFAFVYGLAMLARFMSGRWMGHRVIGDDAGHARDAETL